ncbi:baseplate J/gp47 family protein [Roseibium sp.]|uniref:baseplate J/gp47 family protein n=1 Tax=Roseibium sp. TaxID=1936156 RepID=UPI003D0E3C8F
MSDALHLLTPPSIIDEFSAEAIFQRKLGVFLASYKAATGNDYTSLTESNIVVRLLRADAEDEANARQRHNERYRSRFVYFASGDNLVHLMRDEGLEPVDGETKERRQERIILGRTGSSAAGPPEWYQRHAIAVAPNEIEAIAVDFPDASTVRVAILAKTVDGIPPQDLVARVGAKLTSEAVHPEDHIEIIVMGAEPVPVTVRARIVLEPDTDPAVFNALDRHYRDGFAARRALGRDMPWSWSSARLQVPGVYSVEELGAPPPDVHPYQVATLDSLVLELASGRAY